MSQVNVVLDSQILSSVQSCGRLTDFRFNHNLVPISGKGKSMEMGSLMHKLLETYRRSLMKGMSRIDAIVEAEDAGRNYDEEETKLEASDTIKVFDTFHEYLDFYKNDSWTTIGVETVRGAVIYEDEEIKILWKAKFDWIVDTNNGIYSVDTKTFSRYKNTLSLNNQFSGQCVVMGTRTVFLDKVSFAKDSKYPKFSRPPINYTADRLAEWVDIVAYWAKVYVNYSRSEYWPPNFTHCDKWSGCMFKGVCEADRNMREEEIRMNFVKGEPWEISDSEE